MQAAVVAGLNFGADGFRFNLETVVLVQKNRA